MARKDFIPNGVRDFVEWHDNYNTQITTVGGTVGIGPAGVAEIAADNTGLKTDDSDATAKKSLSQAATAKRNGSIARLTGKRRAEAARIRAHANFTEAIGRQLRIIGPEFEIEIAPDRPDLRLESAQHGRVVIGFVKAGFSGVEIWRKRGGELEFSFLARDTESPYYDTAANLDESKPEHREYRAQYLDGDEVVGPLSDALIVTVPKK